LMDNAVNVGSYFLERLDGLHADFPHLIRDVRGMGLMIGMEFAVPSARLVMQTLLSQGVVINAVGDSILRFVPPLIVTASDCDRVVRALRDALASL
jgi:acetylornithine/N-succinyldiaminopimelate aminotransferase